MARQFDKKIVLEDGQEYYGYGFGYNGRRVCEIIFNTAAAGYQEIISDPGCYGLMVVMTYPLIGNYGIADEDFESKAIHAGALVVREYNDNPSNFRYTKTLSEVMEENQVPGIYGVDTRMLTRRIRDNGTCKALITEADTPLEQVLRTLRETELPRDAARRVSCKKKWYSRTSNHKYNVAVLDCGVKMGVIRALNAQGCNMTILPCDTPAAEIEQIHPDGLLVSSGPGDPRDLPQAVNLLRNLRGKYPTFGIDLGHLLIALSYGAGVDKLKAGHHGGNQAVRSLLTGKIEITAQGHTFAVNADSLPGTGLEPTHVNLIDGTIEGIRNIQDQTFGVQFHPESAPGPHDSAHLLGQFIAMMEQARAEKGGTL